jgi:L-serine deaminase
VSEDRFENEDVSLHPDLEFEAAELVGGGFIEWKGYQPPKKGQPKYPYSTMVELLRHAQRDKLSVAQVVKANELQHHVGMTCDPVAGFVQVPCIERCAFGAVKAWTASWIASNEIPANRRVDFDTTVNAMALTAKEMNSKYKQTSEGGLAVSVVLC